MKDSNQPQSLFRLFPSESRDSNKKKSYFSALFAKSYWYPNLLKIEPNIEVHPVVARKDMLKTKESILHAVSDLEKIDQKEINLNNIDAVKIPVVPQIVVKEEKVQKTKISLNQDFDTYLKNLNSSWGLSDIVGINGVTESGIEIIFYGLEKYTKSELSGFDIVPYSALASSQDMLGKMITAMKLSPGTFLRCPLFDFDNPLEHLLQVVNQFRPKVVVCLGAIATNTLLEKKVRLANVHGDITQKIVELKTRDGANNSLSFHVSPLFHPELLEINQSMKRTAWIDMQRVMKFISEN